MSRVSGPDRRPISQGYLPYWSQPSSGVALLEDGSRLAMAKLHGKPHELLDGGERLANAELLNRVWRDVGDDNIAICVHFVRRKAWGEYIAPRFRNEFSRKLHEAHWHAVIKDKLFTNDWYLSLIVSPRGISLGSRRFRRKLARWFYLFRQNADRDFADTSEIEGLWLKVAQNFSTYSMQRLGYRYNDTRYARYTFSEIGEAIRLFFGMDGAVPITTGRLGDDIYTDSRQPIFERRIFRILPPGCDDDSDDAAGVKWGSLYGLNNYMERAGPDVFDAALTLPMELVISQHYCFTATPDAVGRLQRTERQIRASGKRIGRKARKGLREAADDTQSREVAHGEHDISIAIYGPSHSALQQNSAIAEAALVSTGAQLVLETGGNLSQFFGQAPGNYDYCTHPGEMGSRDFVKFANFGAFPRGQKTGKWGQKAVTIPTTAATSFDLVPHVGDVGMMAWFGKTGSGKTLAMCFLMAMFDQYMVDAPGLLLLYDKDDGCKIFIEVLGGNYLTVAYGEPSGLMPLKGFKENTPYARACLTKLTRTMVLRDKLGPIPPEDNAWIERGVDAQLDLPLPMRSFWGLRRFLGYDNPLGAGPRLERWCRGNAMGWLFDGGDDFLDFEVPALGINLGRILDDEEALEPVRQYLEHRTTPIIDGRRVAGFFDEAGKTVGERDADYWRTWRKSNGIAMLATQQPEDFLHTQWGRAILDQCMRMGFFATPGASRKIYCGDEKDGGLGCTEGEYDAITNRMSRFQVLVKERGLNAESVIWNFDLAALEPWYLHVLSGTANRVKLWNDLREKFPNAMAAFAERSREAVD